MTRPFVIVLCAIVLGTARADAQTWEASALFGHVPSVTFDRRAPELEELGFRGTWIWGVQGGRNLSPRWSVEGLWTRQNTALEVETRSGTADLFDTTIDRIEGNVLVNLGRSSRLQPFAMGGLGASVFSATDVPGETMLAFNLGGGLKFFPASRFGVRGQFRYIPTLLDDEDAGDFCDPFGFCQAMLQQMEFTVGVVVRF